MKHAAKKNVLLAVPSLLYAINNYLKFVMQLYFRPATVKMLSNLKVGVKEREEQSALRSS